MAGFRLASAMGRASFKGINGNMVVGLKKLDQDGVTLSGINGNIELQFGSDVNADFDARGMNGRVISDLPNVSIDKSKRGNYWARIGNGGTGITAKGINGNIRFTRGRGSLHCRTSRNTASRTERGSAGKSSLVYLLRPGATALGYGSRGFRVVNVGAFHARSFSFHCGNVSRKNLFTSSTRARYAG